MWPLQYLSVRAVQTLARSEGLSFEDLSKTAALGVCGISQKACVRNSCVLLEAPLLGSTLKSLEEVCPPP